MAGAGTGSPQFFLCPNLRRIWPRTTHDVIQHRTRPTGRHKPGPPRRNGSLRRVARAMEYRCTCGHTGWSTHSDLARHGVDLNLFAWVDVDPNPRFPR